MNMPKQIKMFCEMFDCDRAYAKQCFADITEFIETALTMGESVKFPGVVELRVDYIPPRNIYNFKTGVVEPSKGKFKPGVRYGKKITESVTSASVLTKKAREKQGKQGGDDAHAEGD